MIRNLSILMGGGLAVSAMLVSTGRGDDAARASTGTCLVYVGTYTAYSGHSTGCEMMETERFVDFNMIPLRGAASAHKGLALFPRRIDGRYAAIGRLDHESLYFMQSDDRHAWNYGKRILGPKYPWELIQMGNCGSPIELDEGWLVLTHGVGAVRRYSLGVALLDKEDPRKVIARSKEPLLTPSDISCSI